MSPSRASLAAALLCAVAACTPASPRTIGPGRLAGETGAPPASPALLASPSPSPSPVVETAAAAGATPAGRLHALDPAAVDDLRAFPAGDGAGLPANEPGADRGTASGAEPAGEPAGDPAGPVEPAATPQPTCPPVPADIPPVDAVYHGATSLKQVALTFDDGYNTTVTQRILAILQRQRVNATFFPTGLAVAAAPSLWRSVAAAGFPIANHTYGHRVLAGRCYATQLSDLARQRTVLDGLGIPSLSAMRPPGGAWDQVTRYASHAAGADAIVLWDVDTRDWDGLSSGAIARRALAGHEGSIILMHTFPANTAAALPAIISGFRARGFGFVTVGTMLGLGGSVPY